MKFAMIALMVFAGAWAQAQTNSCSIQPGYVDCEGIQGVYDDGCQVTCPDTQKAECQPAIGFANFDPDHPNGTGAFGQCTLFNSTCTCR